MTTDATSKDNSTDWRDKSFLREKYHGEGLTISEIAEEVGRDYGGVYYWMEQHGIERRSRSDHHYQEELDHRDPEVLRELYHEQGLATREVADKLDCDSATVIRWMGKHDIPRRDRREEARKASTNGYARLITTEQGYEIWRDNAIGRPGEHSVRVHRLLAAAEHGVEALDGMHVHHKNNCSWDNRPSNLELLTPSEHSSIHNNEFSPKQE